MKGYHRRECVGRKSILVFIIFITFILSSCDYSKLDENVNESIAGENENIVLDGNVIITYIGDAFNTEDISSVIQNNRDFLDELFPDGDIYIYDKGYYHVNSNSGILDLNFIILPVIQNGYITGNIMLHRNESGIIEVGFSTGEEENSQLNRLMKEKEKLALLYSSYSEFAITEDNVVYTIYGSDPDTIIDNEKLFSGYSTQFNTVTTKDLFDIKLLRKIE